MAEVDFAIGHKSYTLTCQEGEERHLKRAAGLLDTEAQAILGQAGRIPEPRLLLLAGLMLADRTSALEDRAISAERELATDDAGEPTIISAGGGAQEAVELKTVSPQYLGAVVVCDGADSPQVQLAVTQAVAQFTGLSTDHISVLRKQPDPQSK